MYTSHAWAEVLSFDMEVCGMAVFPGEDEANEPACGNEGERGHVAGRGKAGFHSPCTEPGG